MDVVGEVRDLCKEFKISFVHVKRAANDEADNLAEEGVGCQNLYIQLSDV